MKNILALAVLLSSVGKKGTGYFIKVACPLFHCQLRR